MIVCWSVSITVYNIILVLNDGRSVIPYHNWRWAVCRLSSMGGLLSCICIFIIASVVICCCFRSSIDPNQKLTIARAGSSGWIPNWLQCPLKCRYLMTKSTQHIRIFISVHARSSTLLIMIISIYETFLIIASSFPYPIIGNCYINWHLDKLDWVQDQFHLDCNQDKWAPGFGKSWTTIVDGDK
jgi:nucleoside recognition membrane protein YjiH